jgi:hypothetical protein
MRDIMFTAVAALGFAFVGITLALIGETERGLSVGVCAIALAILAHGNRG